ncbi:hypothetical protein PV646_42955 [Streptomyces sp. ID05-26A]|nr:hypothetical protein [Streptomyces sp. ID05-26A]
MRARAGRSLQGVIVALAGFGLLAGCGGQETGAESPGAAVDAYVIALNTKDAAALEKLATPGNNAAADIKQRLDAYGGKDIRLEEKNISSDVAQDVASAQLRGRTASGAYEERLTLTVKDDRWHVVLGSARPDPAKPTAGTSPG